MNYETIAAYLAGELREQEKQEVDNWISESPENRQNFRRWQILWQASQQQVSNFEPDVDKAWQKVNPEKFVQNISTVSKPLGIFYWIKRMAAVLILACTLGFAAIQLVKHLPDSSLTWVEKVTPEKVKTAVTLPDGTTVWLNEQSKLRYPEEFGKATREVFLEGEAFFDVKKYADKPFLIHTGQTRTQVLGTSFNIRGHEAEATVEVAVLSGKVAFSFASDTHSDKAMVFPQQKAVYDKKEANIQVFSNEDPNFLAWKTGKLVFKNTPLRKTLQTLASYYQVGFTATDSSLLNCEFTGSFTNASLQDVLEVFAFGRDISYKKAGNTYLLSGEGCQ